MRDTNGLGASVDYRLWTRLSRCPGYHRSPAARLPAHGDPERTLHWALRYGVGASARGQLVVDRGVVAKSVDQGNEPAMQDGVLLGERLSDTCFLIGS